MPIIYPQPPFDVRKEAISGAEHFRPAVRADDLMAQKVEPGQEPAAPSELAAPHAVYLMSPDAVRASAGLEAAEHKGWRFLAEGSTAVLEVSSLPEGPKTTALQRGWMGASTKRTMGFAETLPEASTKPYELRMLRLPGVGRTDAIWLKGAGMNDDLVLPISSACRSVVADKVYTGEEFLRLMRVEAEKNTFDNSPEAESEADAG